MNEYVNDLLYQESTKYNGYVTSIRRLSNSGNDFYGKLLRHREKLDNKIDNEINLINNLLSEVETEELKKSLNEIKEKLNDRKIILEKFGYDSIDYRGRYFFLKELSTELEERFTNMYYNYRIGYNTIEQFNAKLQALFDNVAPEYENKLRIQALYENEIINPDGSLKEDIPLNDNTLSTSTAGGFYFNEKNPNNKHQSTENKTDVNTLNNGLKTRIKNIVTGYVVENNILHDYLNEFKVLFIRVWQDDTGW